MSYQTRWRDRRISPIVDNPIHQKGIRGKPITFNPPVGATRLHQSTTETGRV
ncbi:hypothetical protein [Coleofasciculus sp. E2-BRE-01]|uniref:hypothetical protein n=1 Tax=Coleofasciculus sp. E2-BRE-01 TaxID=3069524 RepID=UPI0032FD6A15